MKERRGRLAFVLIATASLAVGLWLAFDVVWGDRNCAVQYCGPEWMALAYPVAVACAAGIALRRTRWRQPSGVAALIAAATVVPLGVLFLVKLYDGEWRTNVEGDAAFGLVVLLPLWFVACLLGARLALRRATNEPAASAGSRR
jgi:hypothetical protein